MSSPISATDVLRQTEGQVAAELEGQVVILSSDTGSYYNLNSIGSAIWRQIDGTKSVDDICRYLTDTYEVSPTEALVEVQTFMEKLRERKLLETV